MADLPPEGWQLQQKPLMLTRRFNFPGYAQTRKFLDDLAVLSERDGCYPDLNFGKTHVSVTIAAAGAELSAAESDFAAAANQLAGKIE
ncbi:MAG: 4a-hydroxytetrahydrobiopterin dehydratase [Gammaproteobacteria bacterium]|nr:4a-hydroxytetrahydrobiopterin dehydratase [Rhodocyclaceae bacterium]MBU3909061.1 4a-hydroxytetrahydrobiopterin dehydratase [Gammaproteobacteria bacterium]MBU3989373.1 4a-hydroxytetrahydrobiopterin dehydratase [Gammaproteobacteria bacterium]MBU4003272.1 4a-hydroxytetrahydrobiopterin dehydratase [Gammaproteobacteria bacterium]MBU4022104.1 4a-hydroxytetrahydrobiopterin dehydratase [Gammaproteobacteria bacterium]